jgi:pimeloyl-ACP methyl ester carboxylesterase
VTIDRDGVTLSCLDIGSGEAVVLLHGLAGCAHEMLPTAASLATVGHRVIAVDQRGHGFSTRRPQDLSRRAYVDDVVAVVEELAAGGPVSLVGQSMGGHTAMLVAAWHPALVRRLVMLEAGVGGGAEDYPATLGGWFASWPVPFPHVPAAVGFLGSTPIATSWVRDLDERADGLWPRFEPDIMQGAIAAVVERARWEEWQSIVVPTLLVRGQRGTMTVAEGQRMLALRPDVQHVVVPDAGHDVHLEQHDAWIRSVQAFLSS